MNATTTGPVTYPLAAWMLTMGMTVRIDLDDYRVLNADPAETESGQLRIEFTDGSFSETGGGVAFDVVVHSGMPAGSYWRARFERLVEQLDRVTERLDAYAVAARNDRTQPPEVRFARGSEAEHAAKVVRDVYDPAATKPDAGEQTG